MAWGRVQSAVLAAVTTTASSWTIDATHGTNWPSNVTTGNKILIAAGWAVTPLVDLTNVTVGGTTALRCGSLTATTTGTALWAVDVQAGWAGTKPAVVVTIANAANMSILAVEVSGLLAGTTLAMLDGGALAASGTVNSNTASANPAYSSTAANEMAVSVYGDDGGPLTWTAPWGATSANLDPNSVNSNSFADCAIAYRNSVNGSEATAWALSGTATPSIVLLTAFNLGSASTTANAGVATAAAAADPLNTAGPAYSGAASDLGGGSGSWTNPTNADGAPDSTYATWAVP